MLQLLSVKYDDVAMCSSFATQRFFSAFEFGEKLLVKKLMYIKFATFVLCSPNCGKMSSSLYLETGSELWQTLTEGAYYSTKGHFLSWFTNMSLFMKIQQIWHINMKVSRGLERFVHKSNKFIAKLFKPHVYLTLPILLYFLLFVIIAIISKFILCGWRT